MSTKNSIRQWSILTEYKGLPRDVYILFFARLINCAGWFVFPFLTFFMTKSSEWTRMCLTYGRRHINMT